MKKLFLLLSALLAFASPAFAGPGDGLVGISVAGQTSAPVAVPAVTASSAYASGNAVGGLLTFANATRTISSGVLHSVNLNFKSAQTAATDLILFNAQPTNTTITDKTAFSLAAADFDKVVGVVHITDCTSLGTPSTCRADSLGLTFRLASGTTLYGVLVTRGTPTFSATSDVSVQISVLED
jgi:hypothetical protein